MDGTVRVSDARTGEAMGPAINAHGGWVLSVDVSPDGSTLLTAGTDGLVTMWDLATSERIGAPLVAIPRRWTFATFLRGSNAHRGDLG